MSAEEQNIATLRRFLEEGWQQEDMCAAVDECFAVDAIIDNPSFPWKTVQAFKEYAPTAKIGFPDLRYVLDEAVASGDKVGYRWIGYGTHQGEYLGIAPTGKQVTIMACGVARFVDGKIVELHEVSDIYGFLQQLGVISSVGELQ